MDENAPLADAAISTEVPISFPESADGYEMRLPETFEFPENAQFRGDDAFFDGNDPRMALARKFAHANRLTQDQFENLIAIGVKADIAEQAVINEALKAQAEALGGKGKERVEAVTNWLGAKLGGEAAAALAPMIMTAKQVQAFERIMQLNRGAVPGNPGAGRDTGKADISDEEYDGMSMSEKFAYARRNSGR
ncbi:hypothetical protein G6L68_10225 [Agrobacterium fabrum]|uniref:hypothetical protein n=1 Tax=Agrobacterium fabrum TaxID=1176649 RepID=UPI000EF5ACC6|nr:hypothetical protein [Agrobacterium fabrum]AYM62920.1 hypothetical protein At12D13_17550 [Agrobacterium fabrum]NTE61019.1 hypothetical protein [Agrobacterium fabrum]